MAFDKNNPEHVKKLKGCIRASDDAMGAEMKLRDQEIKQFVGQRYGRKPNETKTPANMLNLIISTFMRATVAGPPQALVTTDKVPLQSEAADFEAVLNKEIKSVYLHRALKAGVQDAMFSLGAVAVGEQTDKSDPKGEAGQYYAKAICADDLIIDLDADSVEQIKYVGYRYRVPLDEVVEDKRYPQHLREKIKAENRQGNNQKRSQNRIRNDEGRYYDEAELIYLYLPREKIELWLHEDIEDEVLRERKWKGPKCGPIHILGFTTVPGQVMPLCPAAQFFDLCDAHNRLMNHIIRQAERQKDLWAYRGSAAPDIARMREAYDGQAFRFDDPDGMKNLKSGGADSNTFALALQLGEQADYYGGNISATAGLGTNAPTLGQDQLIAISASKRIQDMQDRVYAWTKEIVESLAWWIRKDPTKSYSAYRDVKEIPGERVSATYSKAEARGEYDEYEYNIDPFSMRGRSPEERLQSITGYLTQIAMPAAPMAAQQGGVMDWKEINDTYSKYANLPELRRFWKFGQAPPAQEEGGGERPLQSPNTTRTNVRENRSTATRQGTTQQMVMRLISQGKAA